MVRDKKHYAMGEILCTMLMNIQLCNSLTTKRGRSFILTTAFGILLNGPIDSIDANVQEVVRAITCLYGQVIYYLVLECFSYN